MGRHNILVIGESCTDIFTYVSANRLAPDLPIPILNVMSEKTNPGMAANVARNLEALGCDVTLVTNPNWENVTKNRYMDLRTNHAFMRVDTNDEIKPIEKVPETTGFDGVVIADYNKGFLSESDVELICQGHDVVFLDTKKKVGPFASNVSFLKINDFEYAKSRDYLQHNLVDKTVVTQGALGAMHAGKLFPVSNVEVGDVSGAGDVFLSQFVFSILSGYLIEESIARANESARKAVEKRGVTVVDG